MENCRRQHLKSNINFNEIDNATLRNLAYEAIYHRDAQESCTADETTRTQIEGLIKNYGISLCDLRSYALKEIKKRQTKAATNILSAKDNQTLQTALNNFKEYTVFGVPNHNNQLMETVNFLPKKISQLMKTQHMEEQEILFEGYFYLMAYLASLKKAPINHPQLSAQLRTLEEKVSWGKRLQGYHYNFIDFALYHLKPHEDKEAREKINAQRNILLTMLKDGVVPIMDATPVIVSQPEQYCNSLLALCISLYAVRFDAIKPNTGNFEPLDQDRQTQIQLVHEDAQHIFSIMDEQFKEPLEELKEIRRQVDELENQLEVAQTIISGSPVQKITTPIKAEPLTMLSIEPPSPSFFATLFNEIKDLVTPRQSAGDEAALEEQAEESALESSRHQVEDGAPPTFLAALPEDPFPEENNSAEEGSAGPSCSRALVVPEFWAPPQQEKDLETGIQELTERGIVLTQKVLPVICIIPASRYAHKIPHYSSRFH